MTRRRSSPKDKPEIRLLPFCAWWLCWSLLAPAQDQNPRFETFTTEDGLAHLTVRAIIQDHEGFMWLGTQDGLNRYDGYQFRVFRHRPGEETSLSGNFIESLYEDSEGVLWIGTPNGLNRFDRATERFSSWQHIPGQRDGLVSGWVNSITEDREGNLWISTRGGGLSLMDRRAGTFKNYLPDAERSDSLSHDEVFALYQDRRGTRWVATYKGGLNRMDAMDPGRFTAFRHRPDDPTSLGDDRVYSLLEDRQGNFWVGTWNGVYLMDRDNGTFTPGELGPGGPEPGEAKGVRTIFEDRSGQLWIGMLGGGLARYDPNRKNFRVIRAREHTAYSLVNDSVRSLFEDASGIIWVGTDGGLNKLDPINSRFTVFQRGKEPEKGLSDNFVRTLLEDREGVLWVGTDGGGLNRWDKATASFSVYETVPDEPTSISGNHISCLYETADDALWVGTFGSGLNRMDRTKGTFERYVQVAGDAGSLADNRVSALCEDREGSFWVGTYGGGLSRMDRASGRFTTILHQEDSRNIIRALYEAPSGDLWICSYDGLYRRNLADGGLTVYRHDRKDPHSISHDQVTCFLQDSAGNHWVGTRGGGLNKMVEGTGNSVHFVSYLEGSAIGGILQDRNGLLWISTAQGLTRLDPATGKMNNYRPEDGIQLGGYATGSFSHGAHQMYFGGINGFTAFDPDTIEANRYNPPIVLTNFLLFNKPVRPRAWDPQSPLAYNINAVEVITLNHRQSVVSFEFAALHFAKPKRNAYAYMMAGFDENWITTDAGKRFATYTNLDPGSYTFQVKGTNSDGQWTEKAKTVHLTIMPPLWRTWWAYGLYATVLAAILWGFLFSQRRKLIRERWINEKLRRVDRLKDEFLANTSHELRTPLNGIIGLAESLVDGATGELPKRTRANLGMIVASGKRLANLVNDILDFAKLKNSTLVLNKTAVDMRALTEVVLAMSKPLVGKKPLVLINAIPEDIALVSGDENRLQQVLFNLIGNAIKFTARGEVRVGSEVIDAKLRVSVSDTGIGIAEDQFDSLFESFRQADGSMERAFGGTGLGLAVSKQLVELHGGTIGVTSTVGEGSCFWFELPLADIGQRAGMLPQDVLEHHIFKVDHTYPGHEPPDAGNGFRILIVDDEPVNRRVLANHLSLKQYHVAEAVDGYACLKLFEQERPFDLILLDVMMPGLSGFEVCARLRDRFPPQELPIIFLTARDRTENLVTGFASGANDYLVKPVSKDELLSRIDTHLRLLATNRKLEDYNRALEAEVAARTTELVARNTELAAKNEELIRTQRQLVMQAKMASLGTLATGIAHEINNPLNFVNNFSRLISELSAELMRETQALEAVLGDQPGAAANHLKEIASLVTDLTESADSVLNHGERAKNIVQRMMMLATGGGKKATKLDVNLLLDECAVMVCRGAQKGDAGLDVAIAKDLDPELPQIEAVGSDLGRVFINLVSNACHALEQRLREDPSFAPEITLRTRLRGDKVEIVIEDNGIGVAEHLREEIFTPFFTTKPTGKGNIGLGLSLSYDIVAGHHGRIRLDPEVRNATAFVVEMPLRQSGS